MKNWDIQKNMSQQTVGLYVATTEKSHYEVKVKLLSRVRLFGTPWTIAYQAPPSLGFSRQEYWSGLPFPPPGDLPDPGIKSNKQDSPVTQKLKLLDWKLKELLGWPKSSFSFLSKNKRHIFHCHQELFLLFLSFFFFFFYQELCSTTYSLFCSTTFCHFSSGNFIFPKLFIFWANNCSKCLIQSSRELKVFPLICKDWNKWTFKGAVSGVYGRWIRTFQSSCNSFCLGVKEKCDLALSWCICIFCWLILDTFCWVLLSVGLIGSSICWN